MGGRSTKKKKVLLICGSLNQTTMMHKISKHLTPVADCYFTHFYTTGIYRLAERLGLLDFTIVGKRQKRLADEYVRTNQMPLDPGGSQNDYDLIVTCTDLIIQDNIKDKPIVLVQEGMTDPETVMFHITKALSKLGFPRWMASTSTTGLSDCYTRFCVASQGYRDLFVRKGCRSDKIRVTGIPNYDNAVEYFENDLPEKNYVLACTSDIRENFGYDNRPAFIRRVKEIANGRAAIFKLHPNEKTEKRVREIKELFPEARVVQKGNAHHYIANCDVLVTQYSTLVYTGIALGKEVHSYFDLEQLRRLTPVQNGGTSAQNIAGVCREFL